MSASCCKHSDFQQYVENGNSGIYGKLTADITLTSAWTRIGRADRRFTGYFDGQGHTISGMNLSFTAYEHGFFGFVNNATIKNFTLTGTMTSSANGNHSHGTVVGSAAGTTVIENVTSSVNLTLNHTGFTCIGGIVGHMDESSKVIGCTYTGTINLNKDSEQVGGIVGYAQRNLYITNNVFSGTITSTGKCKYLAGIAGKTDGTIEVSGCTNIGTINGGPSYDCVAGIVGYVQYESRALITNCYFGGSLSSTSSGTSLVMGGILGAVNDDAGTNFRGLTYCFSDGTLTATNSSSTQIGGIAGVIKSKAVSKVMNNTYLSGTASRLAAISNSSSSFDSSNKAITISVTAGTGGSVEKSYVYPTSTTATQLKVEATPNSGYHYVEWSDNGAQTHNVSLANNVSLTATFGAHTYGDWSTDVDATCTSDGTKHRVCTHTGCGAREDGTIAVLGHIYSPGSWSWAPDGHSATCTRTCFRCTTNTTGHTSSKSVTLGNGITSFQGASPTCNAMGMTHYIATATVEGTLYSATMDVLDIAALGHSYGAGSWSWADDGHSATCTRTCDRTGCYTNTRGHTSSKSVTLGNGITSAQQVAPKCTEMGTTRYTATATVEGTQYSATKDVVDIAALGHGSTGYTPTYTWGGTYDAATCTFTLQCGSCGVEVFNDNITTSKVDANHVDATCAKDGNERWTATGSYSKAGDAAYNGTAQTKDYAIPATGLHTFADDDLAQGHCTVCNHGFFRYTATTKVEPNRPAELKNAKGQGIYNSAKHTFADCNGVMEFDEPLVTIGELAFFNRTAFTGDLIIPNTVITIGINAFYGCGRNTDSSAGFTGNLVIPSSVTSIEEGAFRYCYNFKGKVVIPNSVTSIGEHAFTGFGNDKCSLEMQSIPYLGNNALRSFNTKTIVLSDDSYVYTGENPYFPAVQSATYTRRGIKNQWGTIVVPFMVNGSGDDYDLYTLSSVSEFEMTLTKVNGTLAAGTPVVFRLHDDLDGDYDLTLTASNTTVSGQLNDGSEANGLQLVGTYETTELSADDYFMSNNKFWSVGDMLYHGAIGVMATPFRAYLRSTIAGAKARRNAPASPTELKRLDADGNGVIETADIDLMVASILNGENDYSIGDVVRAIDNAGTSVAVATEMLEKGVKGDPDEPELDEYRWITIE